MNLEMIIQFQNKLFEWYGGSARTLPWREDPSPYKVWISEIMLQQTRVDTVKPYFDRFLHELPTIQALANVHEEKIMKLWEGLGYYHRARNLKKAANIILEKFNGEIPSDIEALKSLPGIGSYTSGAIASIAFGVKVPAIDGNVLRVIARITANRGDVTKMEVKKQMEDTVNEILPCVGVGDFNQALMELGATICLSKRLPKCDNCPVNFICEGYNQGIAANLPIKPKKKARKIEQKTIFVIKSKEKVALKQRSNEGLLANLWEFPHVEGHLTYEECKETVKKWNITACKIISLQKTKHIFSHIEWHMIGYLVLADSSEENQAFVWATEKELKDQYSIPSAFKAFKNK